MSGSVGGGGAGAVASCSPLASGGTVTGAGPGGDPPTLSVLWAREWLSVWERRRLDLGTSVVTENRHVSVKAICRRFDTYGPSSSQLFSCDYVIYYYPHSHFLYLQVVKRM